MWTVSEISKSGCSFMIHSASAAVARYVVDPSLPWVVLENHCFAPDWPERHEGWFDAVLPRGVRAMTTPAIWKVRRVVTDLLIETSRFIEVIDEIGACWDGGLCLWQSDLLPDPGCFAFEKLGQGLPARAVEQFCDGKHVRLAFDVPHAGEHSCVYSTDPKLIRAAWERVNTAANKSR